MIQIREGRDEDRPTLTKVLWKAFEAQRSLEDVEKESWLAQWNRPQDNDWAYVAVDGDKVVANLSFFAKKENDNIIRGKPIPFIVSCTILDTRALYLQERHWMDSVRSGSCQDNLVIMSPDDGI